MAGGHKFMKTVFSADYRFLKISVLEFIIYKLNRLIGTWQIKYHWNLLYRKKMFCVSKLISKITGGRYLDDWMKIKIIL